MMKFNVINICACHMQESLLLVNDVGLCRVYGLLKDTLGTSGQCLMEREGNFL